MSALGIDFPSFYRAVHDHPPFDWQTRLAIEVASAGWHDLIDVPTGCGKTSVVDIAVYHLALELAAGRRDTASLRNAFVVDRRLVVDDAYGRAVLLARKIEEGGNGLDAVRDALASVAGDDAPPLVTARLRGGLPIENDWVRTPCQPAVLVSTVDQVGSRLLFDGYGVGARMAPVHAGLLGTDARVFLDEAHLSEPFRQTVGALAVVQRGLPRPSLTTLTATPGNAAERRFSLSPAERAAPLIAERVSRPKIATLEKVAKKQSDPAFAAALIRHARACEGDGVVGVVVNRVATARAVHAALDAETTGRAILMIGRGRALDRDRVAARLAPIKTGAPRDDIGFRFVVSTQCIEAGADLDFDALVTQAAPLDSLRQRLGRLNRKGRLPSASAVIVAASDDLTKSGEFLYGQRTRNAWELLESIATDGHVDFAPNALEPLLDELGSAAEAVSADRPDAPMLMPAYLDLWSRTSPRPASRPHVPLFLHGPERPTPEVSLVWRADAKRDVEDLSPLLRHTRPRTAEVLSLPLWTVRDWLSVSSSTGALGDIATPEPTPDRNARSSVADGAGQNEVYRWSGPRRDGSGWIEPDKISPGDLLIVPSDYGGCDAYGWTGTRTGHVADLGLAAAWPYRHRSLPIRLSEALLHDTVAAHPDAGEGGESAELVADIWRTFWLPVIDDPALDDDLLTAAAGNTLTRLADANLLRSADLLSETLRLVAASEATVERKRVDRTTGTLLLTLVVPDENDASGTPEPDGTQATADDQLGNRAATPITIGEHAEDVAAMARAFAARCGLEETLIDDIALAAALHDHGKADLRFQSALAGSPLGATAALATQSLAKSSADMDSGRSSVQSLPKGWRHEALSVRIACLDPKLRDAHDPGLVLYLIGSHHGFGRPFFPVGDDADARDRRLGRNGDAPTVLPAGPGPSSLGFTVPDRERGDDGRPADLDWVELFESLQHRYGHYGLARLEAVLRLADHRVSERYDER